MEPAWSENDGGTADDVVWAVSDAGGLVSTDEVSVRPNRVDGAEVVAAPKTAEPPVWNPADTGVWPKLTPVVADSWPNVGAALPELCPNTAVDEPCWPKKVELEVGCVEAATLPNVTAPAAGTGGWPDRPVLLLEGFPNSALPEAAVELSAGQLAVAGVTWPNRLLVCPNAPAVLVS